MAGLLVVTGGARGMGPVVPDLSRKEGGGGAEFQHLIKCGQGG